MHSPAEEAKPELDEATLAALHAAEAGLPGALLDDAPLSGTASAEEDAPVVEGPGEMEILGATSAPVPVKAGEPATPVESAPPAAAAAEKRDSADTRIRKSAADEPEPRQKNWPWGRLLVRGATCVAVGTAAGYSIYKALLEQQERQPIELMARREAVHELGEALAKARELAEQGEFAKVATVLTTPVSRAPETPRRADAQFLLLEAKVKTSPEGEEARRAIDALLAAAPEHARAPEALLWKAELFDREGKTAEALALCEQIIEAHPDLETPMLAAGRLALRTKNVEKAAAYGKLALEQSNDPELVADARLLIGDALTADGKAEEAAVVYEQVLQESAGTPQSLEAANHVAALALERGEAARALAVLETHAAAATGSQWEEARMLEARALRGLDRMAEAEDVLVDLVVKAEDASSAEAATVELVDLLERQGKRDEALRMARQAQARFAASGRVQEQAGNLLAIAGEGEAAAEAMLAAEKATGEARFLLRAARLLREEGKHEHALQVYATLTQKHPGKAEAHTGQVEQALVLQETGRVTEAVKKLDGLALANKGTAREFEALLGLSRVYRKLGVKERAAEIGKKIARESSDAHIVADAAAALAEAGALADAQAAGERIDVAALAASDAVEILSKVGHALLSTGADSGLQYLERAHREYPEVRTPGLTQELVEALLAAGQLEPARALVEELKAHAASAPVDTAFLIDAAIAVGDQAYAALALDVALEAYTLADEASRAGKIAGKNKDARWAIFQRGNVLLALKRYDEGAQLLRGIAESNAPWAREAEVAAKAARLHLRKKQLPVGRVARALEPET